MSVQRKVFVGTGAMSMLIVLLMAFAPAGAAQNTQSITLSPTSDRLAMDPGGTYDGNFQIINHGTSNYNLSIYADPYSVTSLDYSPDFKSLPGHVNVADWISFEQATASLKPGQAAVIRYHIAVPPHTQPGGYYAVIFSETNTPKVSQGITFNQRVGEILYITVKGPVKQTGDVRLWNVHFMQDAPLKAEVEIENTGGVHYFSDIKIKVADILGNVKYSSTVQKAVLPETVRRTSVQWDGAAAIGLYRVSGSATIFGKAVQLPERWVLVMAAPIRVGLEFVVLLVAISLLAYGGRTLASRRRKHNITKL